MYIHSMLYGWDSTAKNSVLMINNKGGYGGYGLNIQGAQWMAYLLSMGRPDIRDHNFDEMQTIIWRDFARKF